MRQNNTPPQRRPAKKPDFLKELRAANTQRQIEWPGNDKIDLCFRALEFVNEAGEVAGGVKKLLRSRWGIGGGGADLDHVADEIGDAIITLDLLAKELDLPLEYCARRKFNKTSRKNKLQTLLPEPPHAFRPNPAILKKRKKMKTLAGLFVATVASSAMATLGYLGYQTLPSEEVRQAAGKAWTEYLEYCVSENLSMTTKEYTVQGIILGHTARCGDHQGIVKFLPNINEPDVAPYYDTRYKQR